MTDTYANAQWNDAGQTSLAVDWTTTDTPDGKPITQRIPITAKPGVSRYDAIVAQKVPIADAPPGPADPLTALQSALIAKGVITQADVTAAAAILSAQPLSAKPVSL